MDRNRKSKWQPSMVSSAYILTFHYLGELRELNAKAWQDDGGATALHKGSDPGLTMEQTLFLQVQA